MAEKGYTVEERQLRVVKGFSDFRRIQCPHIAMNGLARYPGLTRIKCFGGCRALGFGESS